MASACQSGLLCNRAAGEPPCPAPCQQLQKKTSGCCAAKGILVPKITIIPSDLSVGLNCCLLAEECLHSGSNQYCSDGKYHGMIIQSAFVTGSVMSLTVWKERIYCMKHLFYSTSYCCQIHLSIWYKFSCYCTWSLKILMLSMLLYGHSHRCHRDYAALKWPSCKIFLLSL